MKAYLALAYIDLKLALRTRSVIFFNYVFPLIFFFGFGALFGNTPGTTVQLVTMVLILGILGNGLFGAGMRTVQEREQNILRRFKVTPISPLPILVSSISTGLLTFLPLVVLVFALAHFIYGMPIPQNWPSLLVLVSIGIMAFRAIGLIIASVANSVQEANILIQILYLPMLFLSGATFPLWTMPSWMQLVSRFLPASYLADGLQGMLLRHEPLSMHLSAIVALLLTLFVGTFISYQLFRWEKEERIRGTAKAWIAASMAPFLLLGFYETSTQNYALRARILERATERAGQFIIDQVRVFDGQQFTDPIALAIDSGKIAKLGSREALSQQFPRAQHINAPDLVALPGFTDFYVTLAAPMQSGYKLMPPNETTLLQTASSHVRAGIFQFVSVSDPLPLVAKIRELIASGAAIGPCIHPAGPLITAPGGYATEALRQLPGFLRQAIEGTIIQTPNTPDEAASLVRKLAAGGAELLLVARVSKLYGHNLPALNSQTLSAIFHEAETSGMPIFALASTPADVQGLLELSGGSLKAILRVPGSEPWPDELFSRMAQAGVAYAPGLAAARAPLLSPEEKRQWLESHLGRLVFSETERTQLVQWTARQGTPTAGSNGSELPAALAETDFNNARLNLQRAHQAGVQLIPATFSGLQGLYHGLTFHQELNLWQQAGIPAAEILKMLTRATHLLHGNPGPAHSPFTSGADASFVLVQGQPGRDITALQNLYNIVFRGELLLNP